jgi:hypothetical protein
MPLLKMIPTRLHLKFSSVVLAVFVSLLVNVPVHADFAYEVGFNSSYTGNLLLDSTNLEDSYTASQASLKYYPVPSLEMVLTGQYTYYSKTIGLSNLLYSGEVTFIPTGEESPVSVYLSGRYDRTRYRDRVRLESFDNTNLRIVAALEYKIGPGIRLRGGSQATATRYPRASNIDVDYEKYEFFTGFNWTVIGANSVDIELGWGTTNFSFIDDTLSWFNQFDPGFKDGRLNSFYVSPRFSRPLGSKTGVSLTYTYRRFNGAEHAVVVGYGTGYLSPWATMHEGSSVTLQVKSYLIPRVTVSMGLGYWDKTYLKTLERVMRYIEEIDYWFEDWALPNEVSPRKDYFTRLYFSIQKPFVIGRHRIMEPTLTVGYSENRSSLDLYDYSSTTVTLSLTFRNK